MSEPAPPAWVQRDAPLHRLATVRTGGAAELFARVGDEAHLMELLAWAHTARTPVAVVGSGSNLLIADEGVPGLVLKLEGALARIERVGERGLVCGGGARLPAVAAYAARAGLAGIEFGVNIPGTVGGAVRMNANAYGGHLSEALEWVEVASVEVASVEVASVEVASGAGARVEVARAQENGPVAGAQDNGPVAEAQNNAPKLERRAPHDLGFAYRTSNLRAGEVVAHASFALVPAEVAHVKATLADLRARRHEAQPQGIKTFGSTFKNPDDPRAQGRTAGLLLADAGCNGLTVGGARLHPKHANFVENTGTATTAEILALMAEGRRRVMERFGVALEPEVQTLGPVRLPWR
jgi:UDP-N-acetylenolpyruvoylglucosamine reductase